MTTQFDAVDSDVFQTDDDAKELLELFDKMPNVDKRKPAPKDDQPEKH